MKRTLRLITATTWQEHLTGFLTEKKVQGCRERTLKDYQYHIPRFFDRYPNCLEQYPLLCQAVSEYFTVTDIAPATFNMRRKYLKCFFSYLVREEVIPRNPVTFPQRKDEGRAVCIPEDTIKKLLSLPDRRTFTGLRDYCVLLLILDTGIRPGEALALLPGDIHLLGLEVTIRGDVSKTNVTRTVPISSLTATHLQRLMKARLPSWNDKVPVFCSYEGKAMLESSLAHRITRYSKKLDSCVTLYGLRHSFALYSLREGMNPFTLQRIMGHSDMSMTKRYLNLTQEDLRKEHQHTSPLNRLTSKRVRKL